MVFFYIRISDSSQNYSRQLESLTKHYPDIVSHNIFIDEESGKDFERESYTRLKSLVRRGDTILVSSLDRFGRNKELIRKEMSELVGIGVRLRILTIPTTLVELPESNQWVMEMVSNVLIEVLSSVAEEERRVIRERQKEGIDIARRLGKYKGRIPGTTKVDWNHFQKIYTQQQTGKISVTQATKLLDIKSRTTFYRLAKRLSETSEMKK